MVDPGPDLDLSAQEKLFLERSRDLNTTRRRIRWVVAAALFHAVALVLVALLSRSWFLLLVLSLCYIALTLAEKVAYGRAVLVYKALIRKLFDQLRRSDAR